VVRSDAALLRRILQNLLSNAIRYTQRGGVLLGCRRRGSVLCIEVWDTGPGIPEQHWREIFEEFRRLDSSAREAQGGVGLGLAIVDRIARLLEYRVALRSLIGKGTMFSVTVPVGDGAVAAPTPEIAFSANESTLRNRRVWCVDDDPHVRDAVRALLENWGCRVQTAGSSTEAMRLADSTPAPEVLILDYHLGEHTGMDLLPDLSRQWKVQPQVILVTAERDPAVAQAAGAREWGFLYKPLRPPALRALMTQLLVRAEVG
jgi:histidine kinase